MSDAWYYTFDGQKTVGPMDFAAVQEKIKSGELGRYQLLFRVGEEEWQPAVAFQEFREIWASAPAGREAANVWVVLRRESGQMTVDSMGPFSMEDVKERLRDGRLNYTDYGWKEGMHRWRRLSVIKEFAPEIKAPIVPPPLVDVPLAKDVLLEEVMKSIEIVRKRFERIQNMELPKPKEATGEDLTKADPPQVAEHKPPIGHKAPVVQRPPHVPPPRPRTKTVPIGPLSKPKLPETREEAAPASETVSATEPAPVSETASAPAPVSDTVSAAASTATASVPAAAPPQAAVPHPAALPTQKVPHPSQAPKRAVFYTQWSLIFVLIVGIAIRMSPTIRELVLVNFLGTPPHQLTPQPKVPLAAKIPEPPAPAVPTPIPPPPVKSAHHPPKLPSHPATHLRIHVDHKSSDAPFTIDTDAGPEQAVWIEVVAPPGQIVGQSHYYRKWRWSTDKPIAYGEFPAGFYRVHVSTGEFTADERFDVNAHTKAFVEKLRQEKKQSSWEFWSERKTLEVTSRKIAKLLSQPKVNFAELNKALHFQPSQMIFFDLWTELHDICQTARQGDVTTARERIAQFQTKISQLSLWR